MEEILVFAVEADSLSTLLEHNDFADILRKAQLGPLIIKTKREAPPAVRSLFFGSNTFTLCAKEDLPCIVADHTWLIVVEEHGPEHVMQMLLSACVMADIRHHGESAMTYSHSVDGYPGDLAHTMQYLWYFPPQLRSIIVSLQFLPKPTNEWLWRTSENDNRIISSSLKGFWKDEAYRLFPADQQIDPLLGVTYRITWLRWLLNQPFNIEPLLLPEMQASESAFREVRRQMCGSLYAQREIQEACSAVENSRDADTYYPALILLLQLLVPGITITRD